MKTKQKKNQKRKKEIETYNKGKKKKKVADGIDHDPSSHLPLVRPHTEERVREQTGRSREIQTWI